jgi:hypothetical protein
VHGNESAMNDFVSVIAGTMSPTEFFKPERIQQIFAAASGRSAE